MGPGMNKVFLIGNLGSDPEMRHFPDGTAVAQVNIATNEYKRGAPGEKGTERVEWHRVSFVGRQAEVAGDHLRKGSKVFIEGSLRSRKWTAPDGAVRNFTEVRVSQFIFLDRAGDAPGGGGYGDSYGKSGGGSYSGKSSGGDGGSSRTYGDKDDSGKGGGGGGWKDKVKDKEDKPKDDKDKGKDRRNEKPKEKGKAFDSSYDDFEDLDEDIPF